MAVALLMPSSGEPSSPAWADWLVAHGGDKAGHLALFFGQAFWLSRVLGGTRASLGPHLAAAAVAAAYGLILETGQLAVPSRGFEVGDLVANAVGAFLWPLWSAVRSRR